MKEVYGSMALDNKKIFTTDDIKALPEGIRAELIDGEIFDKSIPPTLHQQLLGEFMYLLHNLLTSVDENYKLYPSLGVFVNNDIYNYFEPDLLVILPSSPNDSQLQHDGCHGAPDWIIEVVDSSSQTMDYLRKRYKYQEIGVQEYWIIDPKIYQVSVYHFHNDAVLKTYSFDDIIPIGIINNLYIDFKELDY